MYLEILQDLKSCWFRVETDLNEIVLRSCQSWLSLFKLGCVWIYPCETQNSVNTEHHQQTLYKSIRGWFPVSTILTSFQSYWFPIILQNKENLSCVTDVVGGRVLNIILFTYFIAVKHTWPGLGYSCRLLGLDKYVHHHPTPRGKIEIKINWKIKIHNPTIQPNLTLPGCRCLFSKMFMF